MKQFKCGDVVPGCPWVAGSEDEEVLLHEIEAHVREEHGMDEVPPEIRDAIRTVSPQV